MRSGKRSDSDRRGASPPPPPARRQRTGDYSDEAPPPAAAPPRPAAPVAAAAKRAPGAAAAAPRAALTAAEAHAAAVARLSGGLQCGTEAHPVFLPPSGDVPSPFYSKPISSEALAALPKCPIEFATMVANFHVGRGHTRFKVPHLAGAELPLQRVFDEVIQRGGCLSVTQMKAWRDVVRACCPRYCSLFLLRVSVRLPAS